MRTIVPSCENRKTLMKIVDSQCKEALRHHADAATGRCFWCGEKIARKKPRIWPEPVPSDLDEAYGYMWDPDYAH